MANYVYFVDMQHLSQQDATMIEQKLDKMDFLIEAETTYISHNTYRYNSCYAIGSKASPECFLKFPPHCTVYDVTGLNTNDQKDFNIHKKYDLTSRIVVRT